MNKVDELMSYVHSVAKGSAAELRTAIEQALAVEWENGRCAGVELSKKALEAATAVERERCAKVCEDNGMYMLAIEVRGTK